MTSNKLLRFCPLLLPLLLSLSASQDAFAQAQALNLSTRMYLDPGADAIAGLIITGTGTGQKTLVFRGLGPSLPTPHLIDPILGKNNLGSVMNDNWGTSNVPPGFEPTFPSESASMMDFSAGPYTAILSGTTAADSGLALVEIYDLTPATLTLANLSTRAFVGTGANIVIAGFILDPNGGGNERLVLRGIGPSLTAANVLANPVLELRDGNGSAIRVNDNWRDSQEAEIAATTLAPEHDLEAAMVVTLPPGPYTVLLAGSGNTTGNGLVEIYDLGPG